MLIALQCFIYQKLIKQNAQAAAAFIKEGEPSVENSPRHLDERKLVPNDIEIDLAILSYRYNTPVNIVRMWHKQFGHISANKILRANSRPAPVVVRINNTLIRDDDFFKNIQN